MKYAFYLRLVLCAAGLQLVASGSAFSEASADSAAHALAQKFIDGPAREARDEKRRVVDRRRSQLPKEQRDAVEKLPPSTSVHQSQVLERERRDELDALSARLKRARKDRVSRQDEGLAVQVLAPPASLKDSKDSRTVEAPNAMPQVPVGGQHMPPFANVRRVAVLLVLRPSARSSRRFHRTADPVICLGPRCYVSAGAGQPARAMSRRRALGPGNSLGRRAGACRRSPSCIFRDVDLGQGNAQLQPVDLGWIRHDRRRPVAVVADPTCKVVKRRLTCDWTIEGRDYRLWVVPEQVVRGAGEDALRKALASGLRGYGQHADARRAIAPAGPMN